METKLRDLEGYHGEIPHFSWPGGRKLAVQFVLNLEEVVKIQSSMEISIPRLSFQRS